MWKDFGQSLYGPFDIVVAAEKPEDRLNRVIALFDEHPDDHTLLFHVLGDDIARNCKALQQRV